MRKFAFNLVMNKDFKPISLIGSLYKILGKLLPRRLKGLISCVVVDSQRGVLEILDVVLVANARLDSRLVCGLYGLIC